MNKRIGFYVDGGRRELQFIPVDSTMATHLAYDLVNESLFMVYKEKGWIYEYHGLDVEHYVSILNSKSIGTAIKDLVHDTKLNYTRRFDLEFSLSAEIAFGDMAESEVKQEKEVPSADKGAVYIEGFNDGIEAMKRSDIAEFMDSFEIPAPVHPVARMAVTEVMTGLKALVDQFNQDGDYIVNNFAGVSIDLSAKPISKEEAPMVMQEISSLREQAKINPSIQILEDSETMEEGDAFPSMSLTAAKKHTA